MGLFERLGVEGLDNFAYYHGLIEASKRALTIRDAVCTDFVRLKHDCDALLTPAALDREAARIDMTRAASWPLRSDAVSTIWMGAIDAEGRAVSFIQSVYWEFGSGCVLPRTGVLMQNRGVSFSLDARAVNPLQPGRRPFHTLNPPLAVFDDGRVLSYGAMGGDGQPQFQAQLLTRYLKGAGAQRRGRRAAFPVRPLLGRAFGERQARGGLRRGHRGARWSASAMRSPWGPRGDAFGHAGALARAPKGSIEAAHDPRSDGGAEGL